MGARHLSPHLIIEKPILPSLTVWVHADGQEVRFQRWYDVTPEVLDGVGIRSLNFIPDGIVRLVDKDSREVHRIQVKLTDEFDSLPLLLARIEKAWSSAQSASDCWTRACNILIRSQVPSLKEVSSEIYIVCRSGWLELACFWIAFLAKVRHEEGQAGWSDFLSADQLIFRYIDFYNEAPFRGPELREPSYQVDRVHLQALLDAVRKARDNQAKKETLETLSECLLKGVAAFEVLPPRNTATGEIDRIVRSHITHPIWSRFGSHILIECKHWRKTVGTDPVGAFIADIRDAGLTSGFFFCRKPMSKSAKRRIDNFYQRDRAFIIVIPESDIQAVCDGANFTHMLMEKLEFVMFQRQ
jgi:Restriction endonuclease